MDVYLVGGAVRDELLGLKVEERDWVVVGSTPDEMLAQGYLQVGKQFPVFLHPKSKEEYALARTERKVGKGYKGFEFDFTPDVTLEEDLLRRDLTINAMAKDATGKLIDPYGGKSDLDSRLLRHVSPAFVEDPVRLLRVARFAACFAKHGFTLATETRELMQEMVAKGEVDALVAERVWKELDKALSSEHPEQFFITLHACDALAVLFPEWAALFDLSLAKAHQQAKTVGELMLHTLQEAVKQGLNTELRFAILAYGLSLYSEADAAPPLNALCKRYRIPRHYKEMAELLGRCYPRYRQLEKTAPDVLLDFLTQADAFRRPERFEQFIAAAHVIAKGTLDNAVDEKRKAWVMQGKQAAKAVDVAQIVEDNRDDHVALASAILDARINAAREALDK